MLNFSIFGHMTPKWSQISKNVNPYKYVFIQSMEFKTHSMIVVGIRLLDGIITDFLIFVFVIQKWGLGLKVQFVYSDTFFYKIQTRISLETESNMSYSRSYCYFLISKSSHSALAIFSECISATTTFGIVTDASFSRSRWWFRRQPCKGWHDDLSDTSMLLLCIAFDSSFWTLWTLTNVALCDGTSVILKAWLRMP